MPNGRSYRGIAGGDGMERLAKILRCPVFSLDTSAMCDSLSNIGEGVGPVRALV
jgi:hypothetical protein